MLPTSQKPAGLFSAIVIVASLGYFVDIYDLILFSIVRVKSLNELGITAADAVTNQGLFLINMQMGGMLLGGILWGILGDKRGRLSVLFGSILLYSLANIANGFVQTIEQYAWLRLIAGIGLAGELGAGITLVAETLPKEKRGYGTMIVATVGVSGAMLAYWVGEVLGWRNAYFVGGGLGLALLALRVGVYESGMFEQTKNSDAPRGNFLSLFTNTTRLARYAKCLLIGVPLWFVVGILITLAPEFGRELGVTGPVTAGLGVFWCYFGLVFGDFASGTLSQLLRSRNRALQVFLGLCGLMVGVYLFGTRGVSPTAFYAVCFLLGVSVGFWALFVTVAAEQFGTNLRATVATTAPNFARGSVVVLVPLFKALAGPLGIIGSAAVLGVGSLVVAFWAVSRLPESFGKDLDYLEE
ncbi:Predicted arabinose efflux permease, MFS family [Hymenobacter daecheongensis DSM 21074]|uniref:Predicted arabinose efflux permease, MFS family n=1 Tax=Hymenobacter daecheongensis DSM 21074 TaxID=1121955 RepID=A0A1M6ADE0_9BACT|nr:MFS transporter [Hymenobacter daecheongensis]SHI34431.1 Predicted arabinose efflux permease, MFS family [Hymenobacter daecheongensis DSM 21074]